MNQFWHCVAGLLLATTSAIADDDWQARGKVVDEVGRPIAGASVGYFWGANGTGKKADGSPIDFGNTSDVREYWSHEGQMAPRGTSAVRTDAQGNFEIRIPRRYHALMAMDADRRHGGLVRVPKGEEHAPLEIEVGPLVRLCGSFIVAGEKAAAASWTHVYIELPSDERRPTDTFRIAHCGSFESRFDIWLPPGKYVLHAYGESNPAHDVIDLDVTPDREILLAANMPDHDLGPIAMTQRELGNREKQVIAAQTAGAWGDYKKRYGQSPPKWHVADARGVPKNARLADFRGKWVLLYLWGPPCPGCLLDGIPKLMKFYEQHAGQRDKFEILAFCTDCDNNIHSIAELDAFLKPIVKEVWNGKTMPFPVLLDPTFETMKNYGVLGYGTLLLIDPVGNLVAGDEKTLAEELAKGTR